MRAIVREGEMSPSWYFGAAYYDYWRRQLVCYPIPINFLVRIGKAVESRWNRMRCKAPRVIRFEDVDRELQGEYVKGKEVGERIGYFKGYQDAMADFKAIMNNQDG